jgi:hypothetical protein
LPPDPIHIHSTPAARNPQGANLALDLLNCTVLAWIVVQHGGVHNTTTDPLAVFCARPQHRIDIAVSQGLSVLAGLAPRLQRHRAR